MLRQSLRSRLLGESLEHRLLLATDVLALVVSADATLSARPENLVHSGSYTYFDVLTDSGSANAETSRRIFRTNGSEAGTLSLLPEPARLDSYAPIGGRLIFVSGDTLYSTRGDTATTTVLLPPVPTVDQIDVYPLSGVKALVVRRGASGFFELHSTNGETIETLEPPFENSSPQLLVVQNARAWFLDNELVWSTDGVDRLFHGTAPTFSEVGQFAYSQEERAIFFEAKTVPQEGIALTSGIWRMSTETDSKLPVPVDTVRFVSSTTGISDQMVIGQWMYFTAFSEEHGRELWRLRTSGFDTPELVFYAVAGTSSSNPEFLVEYSGRLLFSADGKLYSHNPDDYSTQLLRAFDNPATSFGPRWLTIWNDHVYFVAGNVQGEELWRTDGTTEGTQMVADIAPGAASSSPNWLTPAGDELHFTARTSEHGEELWTVDQAGNTRLIRDIRLEHNRQAPAISGLTSFGDAAYFRFNDGLHGVELWRSDGTESGTFMVKDIFPGDRGGSPRDFFVLDNWMFFTANDGEHGYELWRTDGTRVGTTLVTDLRPGAEGSVPTGFSERNGELWFGAHDGTIGDEIWKSDGTATGTVQVWDVRQPATFIFDPVAEIIWTSDAVFFWSGTEFRRHLSRPDSPEGETQVIDVSASLARPRSVGEFVFFIGTINRNQSLGLYKTNGPTLESLDLNVGGDESLLPDELLAVFNNEMYYVGERFGVFTTDGPSVGVRTLFPEDANGLGASDRHLFAWDRSESVVRSRVYAWDGHGEIVVLMDDPNKALLDTIVDSQGLAFAVRDHASGETEIWYSDGTIDGTRRIASVTPNQLNELTRVGHYLFFIQENANSRDTVWSVPLGVVGDLNGDSMLDGGDVDALFAAAKSGSSDRRYDLNEDQLVDDTDVQFLVEEIAGTRFGDFDLNGRVEFADFLTLAENFGRDDVGYASGDATGDLKVTFEDFLVLVATFGFDNEE